MALQDFKHMKRDTPHKTHAHLPREVASGVSVFIFLIRKSAAVRRTTAPQRSSGRREEGRAWALAGLSTAAGCSQQGGGGSLGELEQEPGHLRSGKSGWGWASCGQAGVMSGVQGPGLARGHLLCPTLLG